MRHLKLIINNKNEKIDLFFNKKELKLILNLYAQMVSGGEWKDYGLSISKREVSFNVYPNPSLNGIVTISSNEVIASYTVYNGLGQVVATSNTNASQATVNVGDKSGVYLVTILTDNGFTTTRRVIVK